MMGMSVFWIVVLGQMPAPSITVDGVISPGEDWMLLGVSTSAGDPSLNLDTLWGYLTADTLYMAFEARGQFASDTLAFLIPLEQDRRNGLSCAYNTSGSPCTQDAGGFSVLFGNERATVLGGWDTLYFAPDFELVLISLPTGSSASCQFEVFRHSGFMGWGSTGAPGTAVCGYSAGFDTLVVEWKIPLQDQGIFELDAFHLNLYGVVKDQANPAANSAVDCIPFDPQCGDAVNERGDVDTLSALVRLSRFRRTGEGLRITEVYYDAPTGEPEPATEFVEVLNMGQDTADLSFFVFTDEPLNTTGEGRFQFPKDFYLPPGVFLVLANNGDSLDKYFLSDPADSFPVLYPWPIFLTYGGREFTGSIGLANGGDDVHLFGGQASPYDTTLLVEVDSVWYGTGGDIGSGGAAPDVPAGSSLERKTYGLWTGTPAQDFYVQGSPSPGDLPPQMVQIGSPVHVASGGGAWVVEIVMGDTLPTGDTLQADTLFYRLSTDGGNTWSAWTGVTHDSVKAYPKTSGAVQRYYYAFPDSVGGQPVSHVEYYVRAWDAWGRAFGDATLTSSGVVTGVAERPEDPVVRVDLRVGEIRVAGLAPRAQVEVLDALGRLRGVFRAGPSGALRIPVRGTGVVFLRVQGAPDRKVVVLR